MKEPTAKPVKTVEVIPRAGPRGKIDPLYKLLEELVDQHAPHLTEAKIALAWRRGWKPNADGQLTLGKPQKANELGKELHGFDFALLLNREVWTHADFTPEQQKALLLHEICHCGVKRDRHGEIARDEHGRPRWRIVKHDVEEFLLVVSTYGTWREELTQLALAAAEAADQPLLNPPKTRKQEAAA